MYKWWCVWVQSREINGAMSYIYPFTAPGDTAEDAIDYVLTHYCCTRDGRRFLNDELTTLSLAWAAPRESVTQVDLVLIEQPQYKRAEPL